SVAWCVSSLLLHASIRRKSTNWQRRRTQISRLGCQLPPFYSPDLHQLLLICRRNMHACMTQSEVTQPPPALMKEEEEEEVSQLKLGYKALDKMRPSTAGEGGCGGGRGSAGSRAPARVPVRTPDLRRGCIPWGCRAMELASKHGTEHGQGSSSEATPAERCSGPSAGPLRLACFGRTTCFACSAAQPKRWIKLGHPAVPPEPPGL
ncbi:hypothetical protein Taro_042441, partial [Colocasia esculenta]|nr:hypothetical protein [Colocasia esculenta]